MATIFLPGFSLLFTYLVLTSLFFLILYGRFGQYIILSIICLILAFCERFDKVYHRHDTVEFGRFPLTYSDSNNKSSNSSGRELHFKETFK